jgi:ADP-ribose pyrophosphatase YjhB (NUDIX family)
VTSIGLPVVAAGGVAVVDGRLLLVQRATEPQAGRWTVPGGRVEPGETLTAAVEREILEETGLRVRCGSFLGWVERIGHRHHFVILDFRVQVPPGAPDPVAGGDAAATAWVALAEVPTLPLVSGLEDFLRAHGVLARRGP